MPFWKVALFILRSVLKYGTSSVLGGKAIDKLIIDSLNVKVRLEHALKMQKSC